MGSSFSSKALKRVRKLRAKRHRRALYENRERPVFERLEDRMLLSAVVVDGDVDLFDVDTSSIEGLIVSPEVEVFTDTVTRQNADATAIANPASESQQKAIESYAAEVFRREIVFVDSSVEDYQTLLNGIQSSVAVYLLDPTRDGVEQIAEVLEGQRGIDAVHVVSHGSAGELRLGTGRLTLESMAGEYADELASISQALNDGADFLIYGCNFGQGQAGQAAAARLAQLTGADIAASNDLTGNAILGGDWDLELSTGRIEAGAVFSVEARLGFMAVLDITTGLTGHWTLDADATDSSGNGYNGTLTGNAAIDTSSNTNHVGAGKGTFDGTTDYVALSTHVAGFSGLTEGTIAAWIKLTDTVESMIWGLSDGGEAFDLVKFGVELGQLKWLNFNDAFDNVLVYSTATVNDGTWHHVAVTVDSGGNTMYIDGVAASVSYSTGSAATTAFFDDITDSDTVDIGRSVRASTTEAEFNGLADDVRVYNRALLAADIAELAAEAPVATDDNAATATDTAVMIDVEANDTDLDSETITVLDVGNPTNGTVVNNGDGTVTYTPSLSYTGADSFDYITADLDDTVSYWRLDGNGTDAVGSNNGTLTGTTTVAGRFGNALSFDEVDDKVQITDFAFNDEFSVSFRFKIDDNTGSTFQYIYSHGTVAATNSLNIFVNESSHGTDPDQLRTVIADSNETGDNFALQFDVSGIIGDGNWHTYTLTVASGVGSVVYLDGVQQNSDTHGGDSFNPTTDVYLGGREDLNAGRFYGGELDALQVFNRALSDAQVSGLHNGDPLGTVNLLVGNLTVDTTSDVSDGDTSSIGALLGSKGADGFISLREAITAANNTAGTDTIEFNIAGAGPHTIAPTSALPTITDSVIIDGTTEPDFAGTPIIELDGSGAGAGVDGLALSGAGSDGSTVRGLVINQFTENGIEINNSDNNTVAGNYIGTNVAGTADLGNTTNGIQILNGASTNTIGGTTAAARNVISGNNGNGIEIINSGTTGNIVQGNYIGTDAAGTGAIGNSNEGINIWNQSTNNTIGGLVAGARNVISGNDVGIAIEDAGTTGNQVQGNYIGMNFLGLATLANTGDGVQIAFSASGNTIGGNTAAHRNIISGNTGDGIEITGDNNMVEGNYIGTDVNGLIDRANGGDGIIISGNSNAIGGAAAAQRNIISGNNGDGIEITGDSNRIGANYIGLDVNGTSILANDHGINLNTSADSNQIGGTTSGERNVISGNNSDGIHIDNATGTTIEGNYIGTNAAGTAALGNAQEGIILNNTTTNTTIGGTATDAGNVISGNDGEGVVINGTSTSTVVQGNLIGTDFNGTAAVGNASNGVLITADSITVGGSTAGARNIISGNSLDGVYITGNSNTIQGNYIGTDINGTADLGNTVDGIEIAVGADSNVIGGSGANEGNIISGNDSYGLHINGDANLTVFGNTIGSGVTGAENIRNELSGVRVNVAGVVIGGYNAGEGNLVAYNWSRGIDISFVGAGSEIRGNTIHDQGHSGIYSNADSVVIARNVIYSNSTRTTFDEVILAVLGTNNEVYNNTIHGGPDDGISVEGLGQTITNNIITGMAGFGINVSGGTMTESFNLITDAVTSPANALGQSNVALDASDINADPLYVNAAAGDFTLTDPTSPAINAGTDLGGSQPDMNGVTAGTFNSTAPEMGAFELAVNLAPVTTPTVADLAYTENDGAVILDSAITVTDGDDANLVGATISITANYVNGEDVLAFTNQLGITGSWVAGTGVLTLSGTSSVANYQTAIQSITYENTSDAPSTLTRTVTFVADDGVDTSTATTRDITITAMNDAPVANPDSYTLFEDGSLTTTLLPPFTEQVITNTANGAHSVVAADVDGDGDLDVLAASDNDDTVAWFENTDGLGTFGTEQVITNTANGAFAVTAADVDGDGDLDVLAASFNDDTVAWFENTDGLGTFGTEQVITNTADGAQSVVTADVDGDGDLDVLAASKNDDTVAWYENTDGLGTFGPEQVITNTADGAQSVVTADVDGDEDLDVLVASLIGDTVAWFENTDGLGTFGAEQLIDNSANGARAVTTADVDGDGDLDVVVAIRVNDTVVWYENTDGLGTFGSEQVINNTTNGPSSVMAADVDGDGDLDVVAASVFDDTVAWFENTDGLGTFGPEQVLTNTADGVISVTTADVDGDGDLDVLAASDNDDTVVWFENNDPGVLYNDTDADADPLTAVLVTDVSNGTLVLNADGTFTYTPNPDFNGVDSFTYKANDGTVDSNTVTVTLNVTAVNDPPVAAADSYTLLEDGSLTTALLPTFTTEQVITSLADGALSVVSADVDGDGDLDVVAGSGADDTVAWFENTDGLGTFGAEQVITNLADSVYMVAAADVDGDGDLDVLAACGSCYSKSWLILVRYRLLLLLFQVRNSLVHRVQHRIDLLE